MENQVQPLLDDLKFLTNSIAAKLEFRGYLADCFGEMPYPAWIKILNSYMLVNRAFLQDFSLKAEDNIMKKDFVLDKLDRQAIETRKPIHVVDGLGKVDNRFSYRWTGWVMPLIHKEEVVAVSGFAEKWKSL